MYGRPSPLSVSRRIPEFGGGSYFGETYQVSNKLSEVHDAGLLSVSESLLQRQLNFYLISKRRRMAPETGDDIEPSWRTQ